LEDGFDESCILNKDRELVDKGNLMLSWHFPENELFRVFVSEFYSQVSPQMQTQLTGSWTCISMVKHAESIVLNLMFLLVCSQLVVSHQRCIADM
jgi:hypothetical protein